MPGRRGACLAVRTPPAAFCRLLVARSPQQRNDLLTKDHGLATMDDSLLFLSRALEALLGFASVVRL
jgi:hypothetical protein